MKKFLFVLFVLGLTGAAWAQVPSRAQFDSATGRYEIEQGATITVAVDSDSLGQTLVDLWNRSHPEAAGGVEFVNLSSSAAAQKLAGPTDEAPDVVMASVSDLLPLADHLAAIDGNLVQAAYQNVDRTFYKSANEKFNAVAALPLAYDGLVFAWNKKMLAALGYDVSQVTPDNLSSSFDTWEKIFSVAKEWQAHRPVYLDRTVDVLFPLPLDDLLAGYPAVTVGGWQIFKEGNPLKPGFEKSEFLKGIEFIKAAADAKISVGPDGTLTPGSLMRQNPDAFLAEQMTPFGLVETGTDLEGVLTQPEDIQFSRMPTWRNTRMTPLMSVKVGVINGFTRFPSAACELLRLWYTKEGMQALVDHSPYIPPLIRDAKIAPDYSGNSLKAQMLAALTSSVPEPVSLWLPLGHQAAVEVLRDGGVTRIFQDVWDGAKTPQEGQKAVVAAADRWINANNQK